MTALDRLRELEAVIPDRRPWRVEQDGMEGHGLVWPHGAYADDLTTNEFIAESRNALPDLLAVAAAARHLSKALEADYYPDKHGLLARDLADALAPLTTDCAEVTR